MKLLQRLFGPSPRAPREPELSLLQAGPFAVALTRKSVRTLRIRLGREGEVLATAPWRMSQASIRAFVLKQEAWIEKQRVRQAAENSASAKTRAALDALSPLERRALERRQRKELLAAAQALLPRWEKAMGLKASRLGVRAMRSRWGSCNPRTGVITLALALHDKGEAALELILVHELAHLRVRQHDARFKALLTEHLPDWRERWKKLKSLHTIDGATL